MTSDRYTIWIGKDLHKKLVDQAAILTATTGKRVTMSGIITDALEQYFERNGLSEHSVSNEDIERLRALLDRLEASDRQQD